MPRELERLLLHPVVLASLALWALNDHVLKDALHDGFSGKLSDVTSLVVAPVLGAVATAQLGIARARPMLLVVVWSLVMAFVMASINTWEPAATAYRVGLAALQWPFRCLAALSVRPLGQVCLTVDPSDLWTLPCALVPVWLVLRGPSVQLTPSGALRD